MKHSMLYLTEHCLFLYISRELAGYTNSVHIAVISWLAPRGALRSVRGSGSATCEGNKTPLPLWVQPQAWVTHV